MYNRRIGAPLRAIRKERRSLSCDADGAEGSRISGWLRMSPPVGMLGSSSCLRRRSIPCPMTRT